MPTKGTKTGSMSAPTKGVVNEKIITKFFAGIQRDDKSKVLGGANNVEEIDIFSNADFIQAEQINSADTMPASTEIYAYTTGDDYTSTATPTVYGYGKETAANKVRIVSVADGGATNPGSFTTLFTSADATNLAVINSDFKYFRSAESSNANSLYYIQGTGTNWYLGRYNIGAAAEQTWNGTAWVAGTANASSKLTGLTGSFDRPTLQVIFGSLYICNGIYIAQVKGDGTATFTEKKFTLPAEWQAVDIIGIGDVFLILCRNRNISANFCRAFWWDGVSASNFNDSFSIPASTPLWIVNHQEKIKIACAGNATLRIFQLSGAFPGALPVEMPNIALGSLAADANTQPISSPKMVSQKDKILYFGLYKTDKTGIYALGQLDNDKPNALILSKRFSTGDYSTHKPIALHIQGPNYYSAYFDGTNNVNARCSTNNSPTRSSKAVYESIFDDDGDARLDKVLVEAAIFTKPLSASTSVALAVNTNYGTYTTYNRPDGSSHNATNGVAGYFKIGLKGKVFQYKLSITSSTSNSPKITGFFIKLYREILY